MSAGSIDETVYQAVVNQEGQYSLWPAHRSLPNGWEAAGRQGTKEECLAYISEVWKDMRPRSLRASTQQI